MRSSRLITAILLPLATARLTTLITEDQLTTPLREHAFSYLDTLPPHHPLIRAQLPYLLTCNRCVSIHAAATTLLLSIHPLTRPIPLTLAISQLALTVLDATTLLLAPPRHPTPAELSES
jgi:Protein of unknown function (DUF1360)